MPLSRVEKIAGRWFRDNEQARLLALHETDPPRYTAPNFLSHWRHECPGRRNVSAAIELKEQYRYSPELVVLDDGRVLPAAEADLAGLSNTSVVAVIPAGRFGFIYKRGVCKARGCGAEARSRAGKFVDAYERPPAEGRVARASA